MARGSGQSNAGSYATCQCSNAGKQSLCYGIVWIGEIRTIPREPPETRGQCVAAAFLANNESHGRRLKSRTHPFDRKKRAGDVPGLHRFFLPLRAVIRTYGLISPVKRSKPLCPGNVARYRSIP